MSENEEYDIEVGSVTKLLKRSQAGDDEATGELFEQLTSILKGMAANRMRNERANHTLQASALINETYIRLMKSGGFDTAQNKRHLLKMSAQAMTQILIDHARSKNASKRGGEYKRNDFDITLEQFEKEMGIKFVDFYDALNALEAELKQVIEYHYLYGYIIEEIAELMSISTATVKRKLRLARAQLKVLLEDDLEGSSNEGADPLSVSEDRF